MLIIDEQKMDKLQLTSEDILRQMRVRQIEYIFNEILTSKEAAQYLKVTTRHLDKLRNSKRLGFMQDGKLIRYKKSHLDKYVNEYCVNR